jgi:hypothetical protein
MEPCAAKGIGDFRSVHLLGRRRCLAGRRIDHPVAHLGYDLPGRKFADGSHLVFGHQFGVNGVRTEITTYFFRRAVRCRR